MDAEIHENGRQLTPESIYTSFALHVQLKATRLSPAEQGGRFSFSLAVRQYNKLRETRLTSARILVVLFLPPDPADWLRHSEEGLIARRCAYWVSLRGAPQSPNDVTQTIYLPRQQVLSVDGLEQIMARCSRDEDILYAL